MTDKVSPEQYYEEIMAAVYHAIEGAQEDGPGDLSVETEKRLDLAIRLIRQSLGLPQLD